MKGTMLIIKPDSPVASRQEFDRAPTLQELQDAVGGHIELVPYFTTIVDDGIERECVAFCNEEGKLNGLPVNTQATLIWERILRKQGMALRDASGTPKDYLVGSIAVVFGDRRFMQEL